MIADWGSWGKGFLVGFIIALVIGIIIAMIFVVPWALGKAGAITLPSWVPFLGK